MMTKTWQQWDFDFMLSFSLIFSTTSISKLYGGDDNPEVSDYKYRVAGCNPWTRGKLILTGSSYIAADQPGSSIKIGFLWKYYSVATALTFIIIWSNQPPLHWSWCLFGTFQFAKNSSSSKDVLSLMFKVIFFFFYLLQIFLNIIY